MPYKNKEKQKKYMNQYCLQYYKNNLEKEKERKKQWRIDNLEEQRKHSRQYYQNHCEEKKQYNKQYTSNKYKIDLKFNLNNRIRVVIGKSLKGNKNGRHWEDLVGYTLKELIKHLKKTMPKGYDWQDYIDGKLHVDHKIPISVFNFTKPEHADFKRCWALENLQLLPVRENLSKHDKLTRPFQPSLNI